LRRSCIKELEKDNISAAEVKCIIDALLVKVENRKVTKFRTLQEKNLLVELEDADDVTSHQFDSHVSDFYSTAIEYITDWIHPFNDAKCMSLRKSHAWEDVHKSLEFMIKKKIILIESVDKTGLFDECCCVSKYVEGKREIWNEKKLTEVECWQEIFWHFKQEDIPLKNISTVIEFSLSLPGRIAAVERVFSLANALWTDERNRFEVSIVKSIVLVKHHFHNSKFPEFQELLLRNCKILEQIHSSAKYISAPTLPTQMEEVPLTHTTTSTSFDFL
jgi:hypothetical protein